MIDFVLVNRGVYPSLNSMKILDSGTFVSGSDHNFMFAELKFLPLPISNTVRRQLGWNFFESGLALYHNKLVALLSFYDETGHQFTIDFLQDFLLMAANGTPSVQPQFFGGSKRRVRAFRKIKSLRCSSKKAAKVWTTSLLCGNLRAKLLKSGGPTRVLFPQ